MIQNSFTSTTQFSVALSYDPTRRLTSALVHSLSKNEINNLITDLLAHQEDIALPMLLPSLLLASRVASASTKVRDCHQKIVEVNGTGIKTQWHPNKPCCSIHQGQSTERHRYDIVDFDRVTGDLTSLSSKLAYCEYLGHVHLPMIEDCDRINRRYLENTAIAHGGTLEIVYARLHMENEFLRSSLAETLCRAQYLSKRAQAQVQTVCTVIPHLSNYYSPLLCDRSIAWLHKKTMLSACEITQP